MCLWCKGYHENTWQLPLGPLCLQQTWNFSTEPISPLPHKICLTAVYIGHSLLQKSSCTRQRCPHQPHGRLSPPDTGSACPVFHCTWSLLQGVIFCSFSSLPCAQWKLECFWSPFFLCFLEASDPVFSRCWTEMLDPWKINLGEAMIDHPFHSLFQGKIRCM